MTAIRRFFADEPRALRVLVDTSVGLMVVGLALAVGAILLMP